MFTLPLLLLLLGGGAFCSITEITSVESFIQFSTKVTNGNTYSDYTIRLASDIDFSGQPFVQIGEYPYYFSGVFDGQGHVISNLVIDSSTQYSGLFAYSGGATIRNVVMDSSCSISNSYSGYAYIGGVIGFCGQTSASCIIENSINMGSLSYTGSSSYGRLYIGGIAGSYISSFSAVTEMRIKNCANYGSITNQGTSEAPYIGGVIGNIEGSTATFGSIQNCFNYGTILNNNGKNGGQYVGGIAGRASRANVENSVNVGGITSQYAFGYI